MSLVVSVAAAAMAASTGIQAAPRVIERVDAITDARSVYLVFGDQSRHLAIGCDAEGAKDIRVAVKFGRYIGDATPGLLAGGRDVIYRFDKREPVSVRWASFDDQAIAENGRTKPMRFVQGIKGSTSVHIRAIKSDGLPLDVGFTYRDPSAEVDQVLRRCGVEPNRP